MAEHGENPLLAALPPATDYLTYLTVLEFNLKREQLPVLHDVLQDEKLTTNIGWDLVHLLLPLLPESEACLQDVACLGNPREVVLKVTELLEELGTEDEGADDDDEEETRPELAGHPAFRDQGRAQQDASRCAQFQTLLHMLCVLHPRIKTKFPSRFLATSIQSILPAYASLARFPAATRSVLMFLKALSGSRRPTLPPRGTEEAVPTVNSAGAVADPEATEAPDETETETQKTLLRALATHAARYCLDGFPAIGGGSGIAWVERYGEKRVPDKIVPGRKTVRETFEEDDQLKERDSLMAQILNIAMGDLHTTLPSLLALVLPGQDSSQDPNSITQTLSTASFSPSPTGALYLLASRAATSLLNNTAPPFALTLIPDHRNILALFIGSPDVASLTLPSASHLPASLVDAVLTLGWLAQRDAPHTHSASSDPSQLSDATAALDISSDDPSPTAAAAAQDEPFNTYLQCLTLVAATHPSPALRNAAHDFAAAVLAAHRDPAARFAFLRDTLEHCPYESIKGAAVGWVKAELVEAANAATTATTASGEQGEQDDKTHSLFAQPQTLRALAPLLFPAIDTADTDPQAQVQELLMNVPFYLTALNLLFLLAESDALRETLDVGNVLREVGVEVRFVAPLLDFVKRSREALAGDEAVELSLLEDGLERARRGLERLGGV